MKQRQNAFLTSPFYPPPVLSDFLFNNCFRFKKDTWAVRSRYFSKLIFASCVWYFDRAYYGFYLCDLIKNASPCWGGQNLTAVELSECINMWLWICTRTYLNLSDLIWITAVWGGRNDRTLLGDRAKLLLVVGHKIWVGNEGSGEWFIILCLFPLPRGGGWDKILLASLVFCHISEKIITNT